MKHPEIPLTELRWTHRFADSLPGDPEAKNFVRQVRGIAFSPVTPTAVPAPNLLGWSAALARDLGGIARPAADSPDLELLSGNRILPSMIPYAARYGGHQFGHWARQLGDGRAITLGEAPVGVTGKTEFQLKGAGPTPYSRTADGRAVLRSSVREFLCSEAMHFLGIPTTRALSLIATGEPVLRDMFYDGNARNEPGAIVCRTAPSFLRFGNFEILARSGENELLKQLADYLIAEHYPEISLGDPDPYGKVLDEIARRTATMVAHWMRVGFVHGVMNTDNMSALGLTIDYGPYGWLEPFDPDWTPNTTDANMHRYAYGRQPEIALWNFVRLCEAFSPLVADEARLHAAIQIFQTTYGETYGQSLAGKLGISSLTTEDEPLIEALFENLQAAETDFVLFFRHLANWRAGEAFVPAVMPAFYAEPSHALREKWEAWAQVYSGKIQREGMNPERRIATMNRTNPLFVLRNYLAQGAIDLAEKGDASGIARLLRVLENPYEENSKESDLAQKRPEWARSKPGCSALSCSS